MKEYICPVCQETFQEGSVPEKCPKCGCDKDVFNVVDEMSREELAENVSESLESSNNYGAEHTANGLAEIILWIGVIIGIVGLIAGIVLCPKGGIAILAGLLCMIAGLLFFLICLIAWAFIKLQVNVSYRLTRIDNKLNPEQHEQRKSPKRKA